MDLFADLPTVELLSLHAGSDEALLHAATPRSVEQARLRLALEILRGTIRIVLPHQLLQARPPMIQTPCK